MISIRPVTAASGSPPAMPLASDDQVGITLNSSQANMAPVRAKPVCISSAMKTTSWRCDTIRPMPGGSRRPER